MSEQNASGARKKEYGMPTASENVAESEQGKRQCTEPNRPGINGTFGEIPASPPKFVSLEELMKAAADVKNMVLAHEITLNKDFKLEKFEPPPNSIEKRVGEVFHKAFWDILAKELAEDPPNYCQAMILLSDIRKGLLDLLLPQHTKIHQQISEVLDIDLIKQQANAGTLDFQQYAQYVISVMGKLCAPIRDEAIANLTKTTNIVEVFRGILETLDLMKLDMANFTITMIRPQVVANSVEIEKKKFAEFLKVDMEGLAETKGWLRRHLGVAEQHSDKKKKMVAVVNDGYLELLEWNDHCRLPETLAIDHNRIQEIKKQFEKLILTGAVLLLTFAKSGQDLCSIGDFKEKVKTNTFTWLSGAEEKTKDDLKSVLQETGEKLEEFLQASLVKYGVRPNHINAGNLVLQLSELAEKDNKIVNILKQRIKDFLLGTISSQTAEPMKIPAGFSSMQTEVTQLAGIFLRLTTHNRAVYDEYYIQILEELLK